MGFILTTTRRLMLPKLIQTSGMIGFFPMHDARIPQILAMLVEAPYRCFASAATSPFKAIRYLEAASHYSSDVGTLCGGNRATHYPMITPDFPMLASRLSQYPSHLAEPTELRSLGSYLSYLALAILGNARVITPHRKVKTG